MATLVFYTVYIIGVITSINIFSNRGTDWKDGQESSLVIILSMFSWLCVLALYLGKTFKENE